jgi:excisionase family DNA binding protein
MVTGQIVTGQMGRPMGTSGDVLMTPAEVAALFRVSPKTVARWSRAGKLTALRTLGGHRRFRVEEVQALRHEVDERFEDETSS